MSFRRIEYFLSVAKHLNFTKAARECYVAQAAISQQIKQFEQELGFSLFDRGGPSVKLTPAGAYFAQECQDVMARYHRAVKGAGILAEGAKRILRVGFHGPYTQTPLAPYLRAFRGDNPELQVTIQEGGRDALLKQLRDGDLDLVVLPEQSLALGEHYDAVKLSTAPSRFMAGPDSPLAGRDEVSPDELAGETLIRVKGVGLGSADHVRPTYYFDLGLGNNPIRWVKSFSEALLMVETGLGIAALPVGAEDALPGDLSVFRVRGDDLHLHVVAVRAAPAVSAPADAFFRTARRLAAEGEDRP